MTPEFEADIRSRVNPLYVDQRGTESYERAILLAEIDMLRAALQISTNGLRHCSRWNISDKKEKAIMTQVIANEALLMTRNA